MKKYKRLVGIITVLALATVLASQVCSGDRVIANGWSGFVNPYNNSTTLIGGSNIGTNQVAVRVNPPAAEGFQWSEDGMNSHPVGREDLIFVATYDDNLDGWVFATDLHNSGDPLAGMDADAIARLSEEEMRELHSHDMFIDVFGDDFTTIIGRFPVFSAESWRISQMTDDELLLELANSGVIMPRNAMSGEILSTYSRMRVFQMEEAFLYEQTGQNLDWQIIMQMHESGATWDDVLARVGATPEEVIFTGASNAVFISVDETADSRVWALIFTVERAYSNGINQVATYSINLDGNNANLSGSYVFGIDHDLAGYTLVYDIRGNGSNIREFRLK